jgi:hypothetical protein
MDKDTRNAIERATQRARKLLEADFSSQLEGTFDVLRSGSVASKGGPHLSARQLFQRGKIVAAIEHKRAVGMTLDEAVTDYVRDAAFTTFNRFVALKMLEARELLQECITKGEQSVGYREFCGMAPGVAMLPAAAGYRLYIESLFDELSTEMKVLFDRCDTASVLWPKRPTFESLLNVLNSDELLGVWDEDETIGWVYQFFNSADERRAMREESQAPQNSRELAVRNQFFTPRYVVRFLVDNTLGRLWVEMRQGHTQLATTCEYMVRRPDEAYEAPPQKDPRDLLVLDPACGSGHFLLYAFDLLLVIYDEAWTNGESPRSEATGRTLRDDYHSLEDLRRELPGLILRHNLHGVDIDPRCAQIAQLALWIRAQRAFRMLCVITSERPRIRRANIIVAEPMPGEPSLMSAFVSQLGDHSLSTGFIELAEKMKMAGDLGLLLRLEAYVRPSSEKRVTRDLFSPTSARIQSALLQFVNEALPVQQTRRRLFSDDAAQGLGLIDLSSKKYDVVLMNPPFGLFSTRSLDDAKELYPNASNDIYACFVQRAVELLGSGGFVGVLSSRLGFFLEGLEEWRARFLGEGAALCTFLDLGYGVLDDALVETAAYVLHDSAKDGDLLAIRLLAHRTKDSALVNAVASIRESTPNPDVFLRKRGDLAATPGKVLAYWLPLELLSLLSHHDDLSRERVVAYSGLQTDDDFRFVRLWWEVEDRAECWAPFAKGGEYLPYADDLHLVANWRANGREMKAFVDSKYRQWSRHIKNTDRYFLGGLTYTERTTSDVSIRALPQGAIFSVSGPCIQAPSPEARDVAWAALASRPGRALLDTLVGSGDTSKSGTAARHYRTGLIAAFPSLASSLPAAYQETLRRGVRALFRHNLAERVQSEVHRLFGGLPIPPHGPGSCFTIQDWARGLLKLEVARFQAATQSSLEIDCIVGDAFGLVGPAALADFAGPHPGEIAARERTSSSPTPEVAALLATFLSATDQEITKRALDSGLSGRAATKRSFYFSRELELTCLIGRVSPAELCAAVDIVDANGLMPRVRLLAQQLVSLSLGVAFGRWRSYATDGEQFQAAVDRLDPFAELPVSPPVQASTPVRGILVDDSGHVDDIAGVTVSALLACAPPIPDLPETLADVLGCELREFLRREFFAKHLAAYSNSRRSAPIYWQLGTPSASYSVWMYLPAAGHDTLYKIQTEYAALKLAHEERKLEAMRRDCGPSPRATERKGLEAQEAFTAELRKFLEEVKLVAALWKPNLDDGVLVNCAPLWRLVPYQKPWQKELKAKWDSLCAGEYDWSHTAMHLWPARVVPKCAADRSLAIAHRLEDVFWLEGKDGKWKPRASPTRSIEELVRERTSAATKAALKSLLEASPASGMGNRARGLRDAIAAANGGPR